MVINQPTKYKNEYPYLKNVDSMALTHEQINLWYAYRRFFTKTAKHPKFKSVKSERKSYTTGNNSNNVLRISNSAIRLPKIGFVEATIHRPPGEEWKIKKATISQDGIGKYYASILFEFDIIIQHHNIDTTKIIGLDYKSNGLYMDSNGNIGSNHKYLKENEKKLSKAQKKLNRKMHDSKNYEKQRKKVAKIYRHITNQRKDTMHKISRMLVNNYDIICVESLNLISISKCKKFRLGKSTMDNGFGMLRNFIIYKAKLSGKTVIKVDKFYPSTKICSRCGHIHNMELKDRIYRCSECGLELDRDINAAINIKNEGLRLFLQTA